MPLNRLNGCQARAARAMLSWSVRELAKRSGLSESSIRRIESSFGVPENVTTDMLLKLRDFYEGRGFTFVFDDDVKGPGVHWKRKERRKSATDRRGSGSGSGPVEAASDIISIPWIF